MTIFTQAQIWLNESVSEGITTMEKAHPNRKLIPEVSCYTDLMIITTTEQKESKKKGANRVMGSWKTTAYIFTLIWENDFSKRILSWSLSTEKDNEEK